MEKKKDRRKEAAYTCINFHLPNDDHRRYYFEITESLIVIYSSWSDITVGFGRVVDGWDQMMMADRKVLGGNSSNVAVGGRTQPIKSLSESVAEGGTNYSVGQRQLMVIARAMLTGASVVIMDEVSTYNISSIYYWCDNEVNLLPSDFSHLLTILTQATASVDGETDQRIQRVFREEFKNATCITVAHRLNTISWIVTWCLLWMMEGQQSLIHLHHYSQQTVCSNPSWMHGRRRANKGMNLGCGVGNNQSQTTRISQCSGGR